MKRAGMPALLAEPSEVRWESFNLSKPLSLSRKVRGGNSDTHVTEIMSVNVNT